jgi:copper homeostasis protein
MKPYEIEVCTDNMPDTLAAAAQGATRIELCARLDLDGTTPDEAFILETQGQLSIPFHVMIRPRGGNFVYTPEEVKEMEASIDFCKKNGVPGVVFGALTAEGVLDIELIRHLAQLSKPLKVVVHKAIDYTPDPLGEFRRLLEVPEVDYVLTSGGQHTALGGQTVLRAMIEAAQGRITVMAAGKITQENLPDIAGIIGASAYHGRLIVGQL